LSFFPNTETIHVKATFGNFDKFLTQKYLYLWIRKDPRVEICNVGSQGIVHTKFMFGILACSG